MEAYRADGYDEIFSQLETGEEMRKLSEKRNPSKTNSGGAWEKEFMRFLQDEAASDDKFFDGDIDIDWLHVAIVCCCLAALAFLYWYITRGHYNSAPRA